MAVRVRRIDSGCDGNKRCVIQLRELGSHGAVVLHRLADIEAGLERQAVLRAGVQDQQDVIGVRVLVGVVREVVGADHEVRDLPELVRIDVVQVRDRVSAATRQP
jgi:hypothetical protein